MTKPRIMEEQRQQRAAIARAEAERARAEAERLAQGELWQRIKKDLPL
ncbi:hypothetical protein ABQE62_29945 [Mycolicibacterium fortuitum]